MDSYDLKHILQGRVRMILLALGAYVAVYGLISSLYQPRGAPVPDVWEEVRAEKSVPIQLPFYRILEASESVTLRGRVPYPAGSVLALPRVSGNRVIVFVDGVQAGSIGSPGGTGNIWAGFHWIDLPDRSARSDASIEIRVFGTYDLGIREIPYIASGADVALFRWLTTAIFGELYWVVIGVILALAALQLYYAQIDRKLLRSYLLNTVGVVLGGLYLFDFALRGDTGSITTYLWARKLMLAAGYAAPLFMLMAIEFYTRKKLFFSRFTMVTTLLAAGLVLSASSLPALKRISVYSGGLAQLNWLFLLFIAFRTRHNVIVFAVTFFYLTLIGSLLSMVTPNSHIFMLQIGYFFAIISVVYNMIEEFGRVHEDFRNAVRKSRTDPLTGAYNRFVLDEVTVAPGDMVVLVDMNNFKNINDRFGHHAGDRVLVEWVKSAQLHTGQSDMIVRTGGDEFIILLRGAREMDMQRILQEFQKRVEDLPASFSFGVEKVQTTLHDAIQNADQRMYQHKRKSRTTWIRNLLRKRKVDVSAAG